MPLELVRGLIVPRAAHEPHRGRLEVEVLSFRQVAVDDVAQNLREAGWSVWPRLSVGLQLHPASYAV